MPVVRLCAGFWHADHAQRHALLCPGGAGVVVLGPTAEVPLAAVRQAFDANVFGLLELCQVRACRASCGCLDLMASAVQTV